MAFHNELGKQGEDIACEFLRKQGFLILERNWTWYKAEIDIIATFNDQLIIAEVKTRSKYQHALPDDMLTNKKLRLIYGATDRYVELKNITWEVRYDLVTVIFHGDTWSIEHVKDAFYPFMNS